MNVSLRLLFLDDLFLDSNQVEGKKSCYIHCGHAICTQCYRGMQGVNGITCPVCNFTYPLAPNPEKNRLNGRLDFLIDSHLYLDFLDELPGMIRQMEETNRRDCSCDDCQETV